MMGKTYDDTLFIQIDLKDLKDAKYTIFLYEQC